MQTFEVTLRIPLSVDAMFDRFLEIACGQEYNELQKQLYSAVTDKLIKKTASASHVSLERDADKTLTVTSDRRIYFERTVYDLQTKDFTWELVVRGLEKAVRITSTGAMTPEGTGHAIYCESTTADIRIPIAGKPMERAIAAAVKRDVDAKKKYYEKKLGAPIQVISIK